MFSGNISYHFCTLCSSWWDSGDCLDDRPIVFFCKPCAEGLRIPKAESESRKMDMSHVDDGLFQGGMPPFGIPFGVALLPDNINAVLNLTELQDTVHPGKLQAHLWLPIPDGAPFQGSDFLHSVSDFIQYCMVRRFQLLVHCAAGISRSSLATMSYLMKYKKMKRDAALEFLRQRRPQANPNQVFLDGLAQFEKELGL